MHAIVGDLIFLPQRHTASAIASAVMERVNEKITSECLIASVVSDLGHENEQYRVLSSLARELLAIPATSAPSERLFSVCGKV